MAKKRIKPDKPAVIPIKNWAIVDQVLREAGDLQKDIRKAEDAAKKLIDAAKADLVKKTKPLHEKANLIAQSLEFFCCQHEKDFGKKRSRKLNFGLLGWRRSTKISVKQTTLEKIKEFFSKSKAATLIHVKETADKEALAKLTDEQLRSVGAKRKITDDFFVEPATPKAANYAKGE